MVDRLLVSHGFGIIRYLPFLQDITFHWFKFQSKIIVNQS